MDASLTEVHLKILLILFGINSVWGINLYRVTPEFSYAHAKFEYSLELLA